MILAKKYIKGKFDDNNGMINSLLKKHWTNNNTKINQLINDNKKLKDFFKFHKKIYRIQKQDKENRKIIIEKQSVNNKYSICNYLRKCFNLFNCYSKTKNPSKQVRRVQSWLNVDLAKLFALSAWANNTVL